MTLVLNIDINEAVILLETESYSRLTKRLQQAVRFDETLPQEAELKDFLALLRRIVLKFCIKISLEKQKEKLLIEAFKSYRSCVVDIRVRNILLQDSEFLLNVRVLIKWPFLKFPILNFLNRAITLCTEDQCNLLRNVFFDNILLSLRERCCLQESVKAFNSLFSIKMVSLSYIDYELISRLFIENPDLMQLRTVLKKFIKSENFWKYFPGLEITCRFSVLEILCELDNRIIKALPNNCIVTSVYCFIKCDLNVSDWSEDNRLKVLEAGFLLGFIRDSIHNPQYSKYLQSNVNLLLSCAAFYNNITRLEKSQYPEIIRSVIDRLFTSLIDLIANFSVELKQRMMFLPSFVN